MSSAAIGSARKKGKGSPILHAGFGLLVWAVSIACLVATSSAHISPASFWMPALFGLVFHFIYPLNLILLIVCVILRKKLFVLPFIPFVLGLQTMHGIFQFGFVNEKKAPGDSLSIRVMSYNVRLFDLYNWSHNLETRADIFNFLRQEQPDILCLQEFYSSDKRPMKNLDTLLTFLKARYYQVEYPVTLRHTDHWGIATFSAFPVVNRGVLYFGNRNGNVCIYTDVNTGHDTLRILNTHLESIRFRKEDYRFIENIENSDENQALLGSRNILKRLRKAYRKRAGEVNQIDSLIRISPYAVVLCGDFNDPPASYTYAVLSHHLKDAFCESGSGFGETYRGPFPAYRIDYILHDPSIRSFNYRRYNTRHSDHFPVSCEINPR